MHSWKKSHKIEIRRNHIFTDISYLDNAVHCLCSNVRLNTHTLIEKYNVNTWSKVSMKAARTSEICRTVVVERCACVRTSGFACGGVRDAQVYSATVSEGLAQPQHSSLIKPPTFIHFHFQYQRRPTRFVAPLHYAEPKDLLEVVAGYVRVYITNTSITIN